MDVQEPVTIDVTVGIPPGAAAATEPPAADTENTTTDDGAPRGRTAAGSEQCRRNALGAGLTATEVFPDHLAIAIAQIQAELTEHHQPRPGIEQRLIRDMAVNWAKMEYAEELRKLDVERVAQRAGLCWDSDQAAVTDRLYGRLARRPEIVAPALARTRQGANRLLTDLKGLAAIVENKGALTERQHSRLSNLFGVPLDMRDGCGRVPPANDGPALKSLIAAEIDRLQRLQHESLIALDEQHKDLALAAMPYAADADTKLLKRYETTARNNLEKAREEFRRVRAEAEAAEQERRERQVQRLFTPQFVVQPPEAAAGAGAPDANLSPTADAVPRARERVFVGPPYAPPVDRKPDPEAESLAAELLARARTVYDAQTGPSPARKAAHREARKGKGRRSR
jgi:hypothetical protein